MKDFVTQNISLMLFMFLVKVTLDYKHFISNYSLVEFRELKYLKTNDTSSM